MKKPSVIKLGAFASGRSGSSPERRAHRAQWHRLVLAALAAGGVGALSWIVLFPGASAGPAAERVSPQGLTAHALPGQHGQSYASPLPSGAVAAGYYSAPPRTYAAPAGASRGTVPASAGQGVPPSLREAAAVSVEIRASWPSPVYRAYVRVEVCVCSTEQAPG